MIFRDFGFDELIQKGIEKVGFYNPTPVQIQCFKLLVEEHRDIYAQSQTGTGKTAAFLLGIFQLIIADEKFKNAKALIVVPTRELAVQIEHESLLLSQYLDLRTGSVFGGVGYVGQEKMLEKGVDILIGTPGRLLDFGKKGRIDFRDFGFMVIDEADRLFDMGFLPDLRRILKRMKPRDERLTLLFSATLNAKVGNLAWEYMNNPGEVIIEPEKLTVDTVSQELYHVGKEEKMELLLGLLKSNNPENAVIFTNTRHRAWEVSKRLEVNGYKVEALMGDLPQSKRLKIIDAVKKGHHKYLVATDVVARGLHIEELEMVINYDVPLDAEGYVHRIGRTARAGKKGKSIVMACEEYVYGLGAIEKLLGKKIPVNWADETLFLTDKSVGMRFSSAERYRENSREQSAERPKPMKPRRQQSKTPNKRTLDRRSMQVQAEVTSVVGGKLSDILPQPSEQPEKNRPRGRQGARQRAVRERRPEQSGEGEGKRVSSSLSIEERLAFYQKKYGDEFRLSDSTSGEQRKESLAGTGKHPKKKRSMVRRLLGGES